MSEYWGDIPAGGTITISFNTVDSAGNPVSFGGSPAVATYKSGSTTEDSAVASLVTNYDSVTGYHKVTVNSATDATFFVALKDYDIVMTGGTLNGNSCIGLKVGSFSIENRTIYADLRRILGSTFTETTLGNIAASFKYFFDAAAQKFSINTKVPATIAAGDIATDAIDANSVKADAVSKFGAGVWAILTSTLTTASTAGKAFVDLIASLALVKVKTDLIPADPATESNVSAVGAAVVALGSSIVTPPTVTAIRQEMDTNSTKLQNLDALVSSRAAPGAKMDIVDTPSAAGKAALAGAVWDVTGSLHVTVGSTGYILQNISGGGGGGGGDQWVTDVVAGAYTGNQAGRIIADLIGVRTVIVYSGYTGTASSVVARTGAFGLSSVYATAYVIGSTTPVAGITNLPCTVSAVPGNYYFTNPSLKGEYFILFHQLADGSDDPFFRGYANFDHSGQVEVVPFPTVSYSLLGSGAYSVDITVTNGTIDLQNAHVSASINGEIAATGVTDSNGVATLAIDAGTYTISVSLTGYNGTSASFTVPGTDPTYVLTALAITPSAPPFSTGYLVCRDEFSAVNEGVPHILRMTKVPVGDTGNSLNDTPRTQSSDVNGLVEFTNLVVGATYRIKEGLSGTEETFVAGSGSFAIASLTGK